MRLVSWNVNGIRAVMQKDFIASFERMQTDVLCLQETKAQDDQVAAALAEVIEKTGFHLYSNSADKKGYSGTAILSRSEPLSIQFDMGIHEHDQEGRVIAAEYADFILINVYTPNSGNELKRLDYRQQWDKDFLAYLKALEQKKPIILCGDLNVARQAIDLARPKENYNRNAGYMQAEIDGIDRYVESGLVDTFRWLKPDTVKYSWFSYRAGARERNVGWRIDYFLVSEALKELIADAEILTDIEGSDHCPVVLDLSL
jgi:exodeoxyribonuclease-3